MPAQTLVGEHQHDGEAENAIKSVQRQIRTMRLGLQSRYNSKFRADHPIMPWLIHHAPLLIILCRVGTDGHAPYEMRNGKAFGARRSLGHSRVSLVSPYVVGTVLKPRPGSRSLKKKQSHHHPAPER